MPEEWSTVVSCYAAVAMATLGDRVDWGMQEFNSCMTPDDGAFQGMMNKMRPEQLTANCLIADFVKHGIGIPESNLCEEGPHCNFVETLAKIKGWSDKTQQELCGARHLAGSMRRLFKFHDGFSSMAIVFECGARRSVAIFAAHDKKNPQRGANYHVWDPLGPEENSEFGVHGEHQFLLPIADYLEKFVMGGGIKSWTLRSVLSKDHPLVGKKGCGAEIPMLQDNSDLALELCPDRIPRKQMFIAPEKDYFRHEEIVAAITRYSQQQD